ncbi:ATP-dependent RNA helicase SrmB, partial [Cronobacter malonaticus]
KPPKKALQKHEEKKKEKKKENPLVKKPPRDPKNTGNPRKPSGNAAPSSDNAE